MVVMDDRMVVALWWNDAFTDAPSGNGSRFRVQTWFNRLRYGPGKTPRKLAESRCGAVRQLLSRMKMIVGKEQVLDFRRVCVVLLDLNKGTC